MQDLSAGMSRRSGLGKRESEAFVRTFFAVISQYLQEDKIVKIKGMGTFKVVETRQRQCEYGGENPHQGSFEGDFHPRHHHA